MLKKNLILMVILMTIAFTTKESSTQRGCTDGDVRLVGTPLRSLGIVEVCIDSNWGRVCRDHWSYYDAIVACNQLGFGRDGALALRPWEVPIEDSNFRHGSVVIDEVRCDSTEKKLLDCSHIKRGDDRFWCIYGGDAGARCTDKLLQVKNITAATVPVQESRSNVTRQSVLLSWEFHSNASSRPGPSSFSVECFNRQYRMELSVNNGTLTQVNIGDIFSSTIFACCVSAIYYRGHYVTERRCTMTDSDMFLLDLSTTQAQPVTTPSSTQMMPASIGSENVIGSTSALNMKASIVGGVLGSIIILLLLLLAMCGGTLLFLLRSRSITPKKSATEMAIKRNVSYLTTALTASGETQASDTVDHTPGAATEYSRIGPSYETIANSNRSRRSQQPMAGVSAARLSERYEFSEPHLAAMISAGRSGGRQGNKAAAAMDSEVPLQSGQHEEYSHLQH